MYKLIGVGGLIRGQDFILEQGVNSFGLASDNTHVLSQDGVSKKHFCVIWEGENLLVKDLDSSNGTFLNQKNIKNAKLEEGDLIAIPGGIFKVIKLNKKVVVVKEDIPEADDLTQKEIVPEDLMGRIKYFFDKKVMKPFYSMNEAYEWSVMVTLAVFIFVGANVFFTIDSVLQDSNRVVTKEVVSRASQIIDEVARETAPFLGRRAYQQIDTSFLESNGEISEYYLFDIKGRILRPISSLNTGINDPFSITAKDWIESKESRDDEIYVKKVGDGKIGVARAIKAYNLERQRENIVGYISIIVHPVSLSVMSSNNRVAFLKALITSSVLGFFLILFIYFLTINNIRFLKNESNAVQAGKKREIEKKLLFSELGEVEDTLNRLHLRVRELSSDGDSDFEIIENDEVYLEQLREVLKGFPGAGLILDSKKSIETLNSEGEDLLGIRESMSQNSAVEDVLRDQGLAATIISLCDQSSEGNGQHCNDVYDVNGVEFVITCMTFMGKDSFPKGYLISFKKDGF